MPWQRLSPPPGTVLPSPSPFGLHLLLLTLLRLMLRLTMACRHLLHSLDDTRVGLVVAMAASEQLKSSRHKLQKMALRWPVPLAHAPC